MESENSRYTSLGIQWDDAARPIRRARVLDDIVKAKIVADEIPAPRIPYSDLPKTAQDIYKKSAERFLNIQPIANEEFEFPEILRKSLRERGFGFLYHWSNALRAVALSYKPRLNALAETLTVQRTESREKARRAKVVLEILHNL